jgi:hypothetical protein
MDSGAPPVARQSSNVAMAPPPDLGDALEDALLEAQAADFMEHAPGGGNPGNPPPGGSSMMIGNTQADAEDADSDGSYDMDNDDAGALDAINEALPELINKTARLNAITTRLCQMDDEAPNPLELMVDLRELWRGEANNEEKLAAMIAMYNTCRVDPDLRNACALVFHAQKVHYDNKQERAELDLELKRISGLYFEQKETELKAKLAKEKAGLFGKLKGKVEDKEAAKKEKKALKAAKGASSAAGGKRARK